MRTSRSVAVTSPALLKKLRICLAKGEVLVRCGHLRENS